MGDIGTDEPVRRRILEPIREPGMPVPEEPAIEPAPEREPEEVPA